MDALINRESVTSSMWDAHGCAKAAKVGLRLKGETRVRGKRGIGTQYLESISRNSVDVRRGGNKLVTFVHWGE